MSTTEKIKKLLEKSRDAGASEAEAEACARKARELMEEHGLTEESLRERSSEPEKLTFPANYQDPWRKNLGTAVGVMCGCVFTWSPRAKTFGFTGSATGVVVAHGTYSRLERIVLQLASAHRSATRGPRQDQLRFERACGLRLAHRCVMIHEERQRPSTGGEGALVLASEFRRVEDWMRENTSTKEGDAGTVKVEGRSGLAGWQAGGEVAMGGELR